MVFLQIIQNITFLLLCGVGLYVIRASDKLKDKPRLSRALIAAVFGFVFVLISTNSVPLTGDIVHLDGGAGPLLFAGYLAGWVGVLLASLAGLAVGMLGHETDLTMALPLYFSIAALGAVIRIYTPPGKEQGFDRRVVVPAIGALIVLHIIIWAANALLGGAKETIRELISCLVLGGLSILATAIVVAVSSQVNRTERSAAELGRRLRMATQSGRMGVFEYRAENKNVIFDDGMMRLFELRGRAGDVPVESWMARVHSNDQKHVLDTISEVARDGSDTDQIEFRGVMPDGSVRYFRANWVTDRDKDGGFVRAVGIQVDLTDYKRSEDRKLEAEQRLASIAAGLPGAIVSAELNKGQPPRTVYASDHVVDIWGYTSEEVLTETNLLLDSLDESEREKMREDLRMATLSLTPMTRRLKVTDKFGDTKWIDYHGNSVRVGDDHYRTDSIIFDVTAEVDAEQQLKEQSALAMQAQKMESIGQLTGGVAHDFNNLLAVIVGNLELLRDEVVDQDHRQMIGAGIAAAMRGADLTRKMLSFARRARLEPQAIDLNAIVRETKNWAGRTLPANITVETSLQTDLGLVLADQASTESALLNLILNARDAMPNGGQLTLETVNVRIDDGFIDSRGENLVPGQYVVLSVSDTGTGISPKMLDFIFEPFYTTKAPGAGSGLGLSMVLGFMHQTGGTVRVYSEPGIGTTFKLYFPIGEAQALSDASNSDSPEKAITSGARILLVEDQKDVREILVLILENAGYDVTAVSSGDHAKVVFENDPAFDLLLTDIVMPGRLQGTTLVRELRETWPGLRVVFMSGYASEATVHGNGLKPEDIRLMKPVQKRDLLGAIEKVLRKP
ncbi:ATP-binding protein [uncultured Pelagimonas sp.]|uniref:hybrid sensor histidine kinase/response regulator n=1 Tax=uncultured Pelagimonas sp. TaxID=1618102 RepID=UPI002617F582|nr:ATP-binding protein [uncultured Pelagimonas sp.]